jgi:hypothetical protein
LFHGLSIKLLRPEENGKYKQFTLSTRKDGEANQFAHVHFSLPKPLCVIKAVSGAAVWFAKGHYYLLSDDPEFFLGISL